MASQSEIDDPTEENSSSKFSAAHNTVPFRPDVQSLGHSWAELNNNFICPGSPRGLNNGPFCLCISVKTGIFLHSLHSGTPDASLLPVPQTNYHGWSQPRLNIWRMNFEGHWSHPLNIRSKWYSISTEGQQHEGYPNFQWEHREREVTAMEVLPIEHRGCRKMPRALLPRRRV
ncbi:hypothetical protein DFH07DRAFT_764303 [Mycena maculata]|uniref:Uncharacterized protein n=1 Tax=Mycena maculata TaxID=230809 RepID=A0AAD7P1Q2_9AGAR|nr:hypothetical protein DFH07DRAFT_764302 [Mycena maculata]KAJ7783934.1 hypothetical protein DFH07DRAFT_764303 [Mycena maculata]